MQTLDADQGSLVRSHSSSDRLERSLRQRSVYAVRVTYERQAEMDLSLLTLTWRRFCAFRAECGSEIMLLRARCWAPAAFETGGSRTGWVSRVSERSSSGVTDPVVLVLAGWLRVPA